MADGPCCGGCVFGQGIDVAPDVDFQEITRQLGGYSGDDITNICRDAAMNGMRRKIAGKSAAEIREMSKDAMKEPVTMEDFVQVGGAGEGLHWVFSRRPNWGGPGGWPGCCSLAAAQVAVSTHMLDAVLQQGPARKPS